MEEEIIYFYNVKDGKYYQSRYTHRWLNNLQQQVKKQKEVIDKAKELIEHFKLTEWGMNGYEPLDSIQNILNENEVSE